MRKIILSISIVISLFANDIQIFTGNSMKLQLNQDTKIKNLWYGKKSEMAKHAKEIQDNFKKEVAIASSLSVASASASHLGNVQNGDLLGAGLILIGSGVSAIYNSITKDNEYIYLSLATNKNGEKTLLKTLIISNYSLNKKEIEKIGSESQNNLKEVK